MPAQAAQTDVMSVVNLGLAIAAIVLALFAILCEIMFYMAQTRLNKSIADENSKFAQQMTNLLGELRGLSTVTQERLAAQQDKMVEAIIRKGEPAAEQTLKDAFSEQLHEMRGKLQTLSVAGPTGSDAQVAIDDLRGRLLRLEEQLPNIAKRVAEAYWPDDPDEKAILLGDGNLYSMREMIVLLRARDGVLGTTGGRIAEELERRGVIARFRDDWVLTDQGARALGPDGVAHPRRSH